MRRAITSTRRCRHQVARLYKAIAASDKQPRRSRRKLASRRSDYHIITAHQRMLAHDTSRRGSLHRDETSRRVGPVRRAVTISARVRFDRARLRERQRTSSCVRARFCGNSWCAIPAHSRRRPKRSSSRTTCAAVRAAAQAAVARSSRRGRQDLTRAISRARTRSPRSSASELTESSSRRPRADRGIAGIVIVNPRSDGRRVSREQRGRSRRRSCIALRDLPSRTATRRTIALYAHIDGPTSSRRARLRRYGRSACSARVLFHGVHPSCRESAYTTTRQVISPRWVAGDDRTSTACRKDRAFLGRGRPRRGEPSLGLRQSSCASPSSAAAVQSTKRPSARAAHGPIKIMFPMIAGIAELAASRSCSPRRDRSRVQGIAFEAAVKVASYRMRRRR